MLGDWPRPHRVDPLAFGPWDNTAPLDFAGQSGLVAVVLIAACSLLLCALTAMLAGGPGRLGTRHLLTLGLLIGGVASNVVEILLRGGVMDWIWFATAPGYAAATNWADIAMVAGALSLPLAILLPGPPAPLTNPGTDQSFSQ